LNASAVSTPERLELVISSLRKRWNCLKAIGYNPRSHLPEAATRRRVPGREGADNRQVVWFRSRLTEGAVSMPETVVHFQIRMPPVLHEQLASWAKEDKASLNALIVGLLEKAIEQHTSKGGSKDKGPSS
jgi:hypothetical protein